MKKGASWVIWIILILVFVLIFPKECGSKDYDKLTESNLNYSCIGVNGPELSKNYSWCYGVCISKSNPKIKTEGEKEKTNTVPVLGPIINSFKGAIKPIIIIALIIGIIIGIQKFQGMQKKEANTIVYKKI